jgi:hypothetical protein
MNGKRDKEVLPIEPISPNEMSLLCRYIDDIFMTRNESIDAMAEQLKRAGSMDVSIMNQNGRLRTSVHLKSTAESYILPFTSDHPPSTHPSEYSSCGPLACCSALFKRERLSASIHRHRKRSLLSDGEGDARVE